jgi:hypothetical protein
MMLVHLSLDYIEAFLYLRFGLERKRIKAKSLALFVPFIARKVRRASSHSKSSPASGNIMLIEKAKSLDGVEALLFKQLSAYFPQAIGILNLA